MVINLPEMCPLCCTFYHDGWTREYIADNNCCPVCDKVKLDECGEEGMYDHPEYGKESVINELNEEDIQC